MTHSIILSLLTEMFYKPSVECEKKSCKTGGASLRDQKSLCGGEWSVTMSNNVECDDVFLISLSAGSGRKLQAKVCPLQPVPPPQESVPALQINFN